MSEQLCGQHGAFRYTWAGKDEAVCCLEHAMQLKNVALAMNYHCQLIPLGVKAGDPIPDPWPTCQQKVSQP